MAKISRILSQEKPILLSVLIISALSAILMGGLFFPNFPRFLFSRIWAAEVENQKDSSCLRGGLPGNSEILALQNNSLIALSDPSYPEIKIVRSLKVIVTAYSSSPQETDSTPFITAAGTQTRPGIVAANFLPFGTKVRFPEIYGNKIFVVEDRMHYRKRYQVDVWFPSRQAALNFGARFTEIEVIKKES